MGNKIFSLHFSKSPFSSLLLNLSSQLIYSRWFFHVNSTHKQVPITNITRAFSEPHFPFLTSCLFHLFKGGQLKLVVLRNKRKVHSLTLRRGITTSSGNYGGNQMLAKLLFNWNCGSPVTFWGNVSKNRAPLFPRRVQVTWEGKLLAKGNPYIRTGHDRFQEQNYWLAHYPNLCLSSAVTFKPLAFHPCRVFCAQVKKSDL